MRSYWSGSTTTVPVSGPYVPRTFREEVENSAERDGSTISIPTSRRAAGPNRKTKKYSEAIYSITHLGPK